MVKTVAWQMHWTPDYMYSALFLDDEDSRGIKYWYDRIVEEEKRINEKLKK